ncbi:MAG: mechanosensitive ion channel domain-containing protein [Marinibacterium sp.]
MQILFAVLVAAFSVLAPHWGLAQSLPGLPIPGQSDAASQADASQLGDTLKRAAEAGVSVIVIDSAGNVVTTTPPKFNAEATEDGAQDGVPMHGGTRLMKSQNAVRDFAKQLNKRLQALPNSINEVAYILRATSPDGTIWAYVKTLVLSLAFLAIGRVAMIEVFGKRIIRGFVVSRIRETPQGYHEKVPFLVFRFFVGIIGSVIAMAIAALLIVLTFRNIDDISIQFTLAAIFMSFLIARSISDLWRMILSPYLSQYRIPVFSDSDAKRLYLWLSLLAGFAVWSGYFATWIKEFGLNYNVYALLAGAFGLLLALGNIVMILVNGRAISNALRGGRSSGDVSWFVRTMSYVWAPVLVAFFVFGWVRQVFDLVLERPERVPVIAGAYMVFLTMVVVYAVMNFALERYFARIRRVEDINRELSEAEAAEAEILPPEIRSHRPVTFQDLFRQVAGILAITAGMYALVRIWLPENRLINETLIGDFFDVAVVLFIGYITFNLFRIWIDTKIAEEAPEGDPGELGDEGGATGATRLATLLPLFRGAILAVVVISIAMMALLQMGVNVSPIFAGAGVVGIAIGFGAQTLVRDIFSGAFFLIDDAFRKGEYIDLGTVKGTVEKISVRSFQLRHHLGALQTVPFGEIQVLTNYSRDWVIMKLPLRVTYDTDVEKVRKLIKKLGQDLLNDPVIGDNFVQPLKSQGVIEMQDSAMIIRVKFMTKPGDQWLVRKKVYEEIRALFAREGIKFAHREVTVRLADGQTEDLSPKNREAVAGAVQAAIDEDLLEAEGELGDDR